MLETALDTLVTFNPFTVTATSPLADVISLLDTTDARHWPVLDDTQSLVGILTTTDIVRGLEACDNQSDQRVRLRGLFIQDVMQRDVVSIELSQTPTAALRHMLQMRHRLVPVLDGGRVVGTLSTVDYLRELSYGELPATRESVVDHCQQQYETFDTDQTIEESQIALLASPHKVAVVVRGDFPIGTVSRHSLRRHCAEACVKSLFGESPSVENIGQLLKFCPTITPGRTLGEAARLMNEHQLDTLGIVNQAGHLVGIVTEEHLLTAILADAG